MKTGFSGAAPQAKKQVALLHFSGQSAVCTTSHDQDTAVQLEGQTPYSGLLSIESLSTMWLYQLLRILYFFCVIFLPVVLDTGLQVCTIRSYCDIRNIFSRFGMELKSIPLILDAQLSGGATQLTYHRLHFLMTLKDMVITLRTTMKDLKDMVITLRTIMKDLHQVGDREGKLR